MTVLQGVLANLIAAIVVAAVGALLLLARRRRILTFYGVRRDMPDFTIVVSRLEVNPGGTTASVDVRNGYVGPAVTQPEYQAAETVREHVARTFLSRVSPDVSGWLSGHLLVSARVEAPIELAPNRDESRKIGERYARTNLVTIGGPVYNSVAGYFQSQAGAHFAFERDSTTRCWDISVKRGKTRDDPGLVPGRDLQRELAFVQRTIDPDTGAFVTMIAGTGAGATLAATEWLRQKWRWLDRRAQDHEYGVLLAFDSVADPEAAFPVTTPAILLDTLVDGRRDMDGRARGSRGDR